MGLFCLELVPLFRWLRIKGNGLAQASFGFKSRARGYCSVFTCCLQKHAVPAKQRRDPPVQGQLGHLRLGLDCEKDRLDKVSGLKKNSVHILVRLPCFLQEQIPTCLNQSSVFISRVFNRHQQERSFCHLLGNRMAERKKCPGMQWERSE